MNDKAQPATTPAPATGDPASTSAAGGDWQQKYNHAVDQLHNWMAKATHYEKTWGTLGDFEQVKVNLDAANKRGKDAPADHPDAGKKSRETETLQAQLVEVSKKLESSLALNKQLRVTSEAMKKHSEHFVPKSEAEIQNLVSRFCDYDEKSNCIVVRDEKGDPRYSKERPGNLMSVDELFAEIKVDRPYLAKATVNGGTMQPGQAGFGAPAAGSNGHGIPAHLMGNQAALKQFFEANPAILQKYLNNGMIG